MAPIPRRSKSHQFLQSACSIKRGASDGLATCVMTDLPWCCVEAAPDLARRSVSLSSSPRVAAHGGHFTRKTASEGGFGPAALLCGSSLSTYRLAFVTPQWPVLGLGGLGCDNTGHSMDSKLSPAQADPDGDVVLPKDWTDAEEALSKVAHVASDLRRPTARSDFSAGPRVTESSLDPTLRPADVSNAPSLTDRPSLGRRTSRSLARFLVATCVGVAATLAWQSYGGTAEQMIANSAPQLRWLLLSAAAMNPPSGREIAVEQPSPHAVQASVPQAASAQAGAVTLTTSETTASTTPTAPSPELPQLEAMAHDLAALRQSVEQLAAGQEQMARDIAKLQTAGQDIRRRISALPPAVATMARKPVPRAQPAPQLSAAPLPPAPPEPPSRPPMPVR